jgi:hypothetical protein
MRKLIIRENHSGRYHLQGFGKSFAGENGLSPFDLVIQSKNGRLHLEFPMVTAFDLFTKINLQSPEYRGDKFSYEDFVIVVPEENEMVVESRTGSLYDFFKERGAAGKCRISSPLPVAFYWRGHLDDKVA